jgi:hypothetical protein
MTERWYFHHLKSRELELVLRKIVTDMAIYSLLKILPTLTAIL